MFNWLLSKFSVIEKKIRDNAVLAIKTSLPDPKPALRKLHLEWKDSSTAHLIAVAADANGSYYRGLLKRTNEFDIAPDKRESDLKSKLMVLFHDDLEHHPFPTEHISMLNAIYGSILDTHVNLDEHISLEEFRDQVIAAIDVYVESAFQWFDAQIFRSVEDFQARHNQREIWYSNNYPTAPYRDATNHDYSRHMEHQDIVTSVASALTHNQVPDEIVIFLLSMGVSSAGFICYDGLEYPTYLNFMPINWILRNRDEIWNLRMQNKFEDEEQFYDPNDVDDQQLADLESTEFDELHYFDFNGQAPPKPDPKAQGRPPMDEDSSASSKRKQRRKKTDETDKGKGNSSDDKGQQQSEQHQQQPPPDPTQVPSDLTYIPNQQLAFKVKDLTIWLKTLPDLPETKDHLKRFRTSSYNPVPMRRIDLLPTDARIFQSANILGQMYMVTYTRTSRKPIFNPVN